MLCFALGLSNIFHLGLMIIFGVLTMYVSLICKKSPVARVPKEVAVLTWPNSDRVFSFVVLFVEIPLLLRICPTSASFDAFIRKFATNWTRAAIYLVMSIAVWLSLLLYATSLIACAVVLLIASAFYALAAVKGQEFQSSKTLGGHGVAQMIV